MNSYQQYLDSGLWKCRSSPTGAHHWKLGSSKRGKVVGRCKWCLGDREFSPNYRPGYREESPVSAPRDLTWVSG